MAGVVARDEAVSVPLHLLSLAVPAASSMRREMVKTIPKRSEVPVEYTWDLASLYATEAAWEKALEEVRTQIPTLARYQGRLAEGPDTLASYLHDLEEVAIELGKVAQYGRLGQSVDTADNAARARAERASGVLAEFTAATAFDEPEILAIGFNTLREWVRQDQRLAVYEHYIDMLEARAPHVRSAEVEEVLGMAINPMGTAAQTHGVLANADLTFTPARNEAGEEFQVAQGTINTLLEDPDREIRRTAWESYADAHLAFKNTMANALSAGVKRDVFFASARRYPSSLEASLAPNQIPTSVFYNLIDTFRRNLRTWHRYWRVRRAALGYDQLHVYDIKAPLATHPPTVPYNQSIDWIAEGLAPMGKEYVDVLRRGATEERWIDIYPNQGKTQGAFSSGTRGSHPFILMSYDDSLYSLSTLAHELGHSMHSYLTHQNQPFIYGRYSMFAAETASNFHQAMVRAYLNDAISDRDFQITLLEEAMSNFHRYFFIMPTLARFELEIHERIERSEALPANALIDLMAELFREGYGDEVAFDHDRIGITWAQFSTHLYANFYVFQYATGISAANALARGIL